MNGNTVEPVNPEYELALVFSHDYSSEVATESQGSVCSHVALVTNWSFALSRGLAAGALPSAA